MFRPLEPHAGDTVNFTIDGDSCTARAGLPLALALLEAGVVPLRRTAVSGAGRAPLCLMGVCFECLVHVDGRANVQSCMVPVRAGMAVQLQRGAPALSEPGA